MIRIYNGIKAGERVVSKEIKGKVLAMKGKGGEILFKVKADNCRVYWRPADSFKKSVLKKIKKK